MPSCVFRFLAGFMFGKPIPLCGHPQQRLTLMPIVRLVGVTTTFLGTLSVMIRCRHALLVTRTDQYCYKRPPN
jgi:hypothetical protein